MRTIQYPFITGGVTGWNLVEGAYNDEHAYEVLQSTEGDQWVEYPLYAIRVDGEFIIDGRKQGRSGFRYLVDRVYAMNRVWFKRQELKRVKEVRMKNPDWGMF